MASKQSTRKNTSRTQPKIPLYELGRSVNKASFVGGGGGGGISDAPADGNIYVRKSAAWVRDDSLLLTHWMTD